MKLSPLMKTLTCRPIHRRVQIAVNTGIAEIIGNTHVVCIADDHNIGTVFIDAGIIVGYILWDLSPAVAPPVDQLLAAVAPLADCTQKNNSRNQKILPQKTEE